MTERKEFDVVVIGGGQSALALAFYLRKTGLTFVLFDDQKQSGGAWQRAWPSLQLFSPAQWSSLPGRLMPSASEGDYPPLSAALDYLADYERRYEVPVRRPVHVDAVYRAADGASFRIDTSAGEFRSRGVISATGSWANPVLPTLDGQTKFRGSVVHSANYTGPQAYDGKRVVVVGGGNSGAQIAAELSAVAQVTWATREPPTFLPDQVDGRYLFEQATIRYKAIQAGLEPPAPRSLGDIVVMPSVRQARDKGLLKAVPMFTRFTESGVVWADRREENIDAVILATGFRPALKHLEPLGIINARGRVDVKSGVSGTQAADVPSLWLVGYGDWTGFASATLIGVGRSARATVQEIEAALSPAAK